MESLFSLRRPSILQLMEPGKFLNLKYLEIILSGKLIFSPSYDFFSLISFIDASPALESACAACKSLFYPLETLSPFIIIKLLYMVSWFSL